MHCHAVLLALLLAFDLVRNLSRFAKKVFLLDVVENFGREAGRFYVEDQGGHGEGTKNFGGLKDELPTDLVAREFILRRRD